MEQWSCSYSFRVLRWSQTIRYVKHSLWEYLSSNVTLQLSIHQYLHIPHAKYLKKSSAKLTNENRRIRALHNLSLLHSHWSSNKGLKRLTAADESERHTTEPELILIKWCYHIWTLKSVLRLQAPRQPVSLWWVIWQKWNRVYIFSTHSSQFLFHQADKNKWRRKLSIFKEVILTVTHRYSGD